MRWDDVEYEPNKWNVAAKQVAEYEASGGTESNIAPASGEPVLIMWTIGHKSGKLRKIPLIAVERDGQYAIVASMGGAPKNPAWYHNLVADPRVKIQDGPEALEYTLHLASGAERDSWWKHAVETFPPYATYQAKTDRQIPVFVATRSAQD